MAAHGLPCRPTLDPRLLALIGGVARRNTAITVCTCCSEQLNGIWSCRRDHTMFRCGSPSTGDITGLFLVGVGQSTTVTRYSTSTAANITTTDYRFSSIKFEGSRRDG